MLNKISKKISLDDLKWLFRTTKGVRKKAIFNVVLGTLRVGFDLTFIWATKLCIDVATGKSSVPLSWAVGLLIAITATSLLIGFGSNWIGSILGTKSQNLMQLKTFSRLMHNIWTGRDSMHSGDTMNRLLLDSRTITSVMTDTLPALVCTLIRLGCAFAFLYNMQPRLALLMLCIVPFFLLLSSFYIKKMRVLSKDIRETDSRIQMALQENLQNKTTIKTLGQTDNMIQSVSDFQNLRLDKVRNRTRFSSVTALITNTGFAAGYLVTFIWGVSGIMSGALTYGMMMAFVQLVGQIQGPFRSITNIIPQFVGAMVSVERIREMEETPVEEDEVGTAMQGPLGLSFDDVTFTYTDGEIPVLEHFSHDFRPGTFTAILGGTGSGKTTLLRMALALTPPNHGQVTIYSDTEQEKVSAKTRCNFIYVPQGNTLLSGTVRDNLLLGNPEATDEEMREILSTACADFVLQNPQGIDLSIGEGGLGLSEGQAQRLCIARSLLRDGAILLFDEVTSALDIDTERRIISNITDRASRLGQTVIFVTHRRKVLEYCDNVVRIENISETRNEAGLHCPW